MFSLSLGGLAFAVLQSLVAPALPAIAGSLDVSAADAGWVLTAYLLSASVLTPVLGRLGDLSGRRRVLLVVLGLLAAGTLLAALAPNLAVLIAARAVQGAAGAVMPLAIGIVRDELPPRQVSTVVGMLSAMVGIGAGIGVLAAGPIVDHLSWPWLFWLPLAVIALAIAGTVAGVPDTPPRTTGRLDLPGALLLSAGLVALLLAVTQGRSWGWASPLTAGLVGGGMVAFLAFVRLQLRVREPLVDMRILRVRAVWLSDLVALLLGFAMFGIFFLVPALLQLPPSAGPGFGASATEVGLVLLPVTVMMLVLGPVAGLMVRRYGPRPPMVAGTAAVLAAFLLLIAAHGEIWQIAVAGTLTGAGIGLAFAAMPSAIIAGVPASYTGEAIGVNSVARTAGSSVGTAVIATVLVAPTDRAFTAGFAVCAAVGVLGVVAALFVPGSHGDGEAVPPR